MKQRTPKFKVGQVVAVTGSEKEGRLSSPEWYGIIKSSAKGFVVVAFPDGDVVKYVPGALRPLTAKECGGK